MLNFLFFPPSFCPQPHPSSVLLKTHSYCVLFTYPHRHCSISSVMCVCLMLRQSERRRQLTERLGGGGQHETDPRWNKRHTKAEDIWSLALIHTWWISNYVLANARERSGQTINGFTKIHLDGRTGSFSALLVIQSKLNLKFSRWLRCIRQLFRPQMGAIYGSFWRIFQYVDRRLWESNHKPCN